MVIVEKRFRSWLGILASIFLGIIFLIAGSGKVLDPMKEFVLPEVLLTMLMIAELIMGILLVFCIFAKPIASFSLLITACFIVSNIMAMAMGYKECLSCFGAMGELSIFQALFLDGLMVVLAVTVLAFFPGRFFNKRLWYW